MSQRKKTVPTTPKHPRSSSMGRKGLIAKEKTKKQSVKERTVLDNHFHRTAPEAKSLRRRIFTIHHSTVKPQLR